MNVRRVDLILNVTYSMLHKIVHDANNRTSLKISSSLFAFVNDEARTAAHYFFLVPVCA